MSGPIVLILGAGKGVGLASASYFAAQGYRVAVVSRSISADAYPSYLTINADLADPKSIEPIFERVRSSLGEPNVVIYNASAWTPPVDHLLDLKLEALQASLNINHVSAVVAAQQAVLSFSRIPDGGKKVFLFTGNLFNEQVIPRFWSIGAAKAATAHVIIAAAASYKEKGYRQV
ncbi:hypothetical protein TruAng_008066 [Truncatella angustata]|nr:hypothetical protein TruAng_008066 [Truncatella angustata]